MSSNLRHPGSARQLESEFIVVGGGSAGCALAARLIDAGRNVTLVEAGPDYGPRSAGGWPAELLDARRIAGSHDWQLGDDRWAFQRARVIGGCSAHNGCIAAVGHRQDYDGWQLAGWSAAELGPVFRRVIETLRVRTYDERETGPFHARCLAAARDLGWRIASDLCDLDGNDGFGLETVNIHGTTRWNTAFAYLDRVRAEPALRIVDQALVDRFIETSHGVCVFASRRGQDVTLQAEQLVLCAGVYATPAILQRSGVGDPALLDALEVPVKQVAPGVGANLHDHPLVRTDRRVGPELQHWLDSAAAQGFLPEEQTLGKAISSLAADGLYDLHVYPVCASDQTSPLDGEVQVLVACMTPRSRGALHIRSRDPEVAPAIDHNYLGDPDGHDLGVLADGVKHANALLDHPELAEVLGDPLTDTSSSAGIRAHVEHYYHPVGTCAMGEHDLAVCDTRGRVHGFSRVSVADAALMPRIPRANTNLPCVMIGERIAELLVTR